MTPEQYHELELEALRRYDRLRRHVPRDAEIVYVVSRSVMRHMQNMERNVGFEVRNGDGIIANFRGVRMFVAPPYITEDLLRPAVCGSCFFAGMEVGDLIICANETIYVLERMEMGVDGKPRAQFAELEYAMIEAMENNAVLNDLWRTRMDTFRRIIGQNTIDNLKKKNEDELSAGDTRLLDEYLHSFMQPGA